MSSCDPFLDFFHMKADEPADTEVGNFIVGHPPLDCSVADTEQASDSATVNQRDIEQRCVGVHDCVPVSKSRPHVAAAGRAIGPS